MSTVWDFYNSAGGGTANVATSDVTGGIALFAHNPTANAWLFINQCADATCTTSSVVAGGAAAALPVGSVAFGVGTTHALRTTFNKQTCVFTFQVDDATSVTVDPTHASTLVTSPQPCAAGPNAYLNGLNSYATVPAASQSASMTAKVNNLFVN